jgi:Family of unknown function (DUF6011)
VSGPQQPPLPLSSEVRGRLAVRVTCRRCGRTLHDPVSRLQRLGPECRTDVAETQRYDVDQDALPGM